MILIVDKGCEGKEAFAWDSNLVWPSFYPVPGIYFQSQSLHPPGRHQPDRLYSRKPCPGHSPLANSFSSVPQAYLFVGPRWCLGSPEGRAWVGLWRP